MNDAERFHLARRDGGVVVLEGFHALKHALRFGAELLDVVTTDRSAVLRLASDLAPDVAAALPRLSLREVDMPHFASLSPMPHPTGVIAIARRPPCDPAALLARQGGRVVVLDAPQHAGNMGACIRVAAAASAAGVLVVGAADPWHPGAVRGAAGLQFALDVARADEMPETGRPLVGVDPEGVDLESYSMPDDAVLVFGSERSGITAHMRARLAASVRIPMRAGVSSLNLATAVAVMLYHRRS